MVGSRVLNSSYKNSRCLHQIRTPTVFGCFFHSKQSATEARNGFVVVYILLMEQLFQEYSDLSSSNGLFLIINCLVTHHPSLVYTLVMISRESVKLENLTPFLTHKTNLVV